MKKILASVILIAVVFGVFTFSAGAATSGDYTYTISGSSAIITDFNKSATGAISIPSTLGGKAVTKIEKSAFADCDGITSVSIPSSVKEIEESAFIFCSKLEKITLTDNVQRIGVGAFFDTAYYDNEKNWQNGVLYIGNHLIAARNRNTSNPISGTFVIKNGTLTISDSAFARCNELKEVVIPKSVRRICCESFAGCSALKTVYYTGTQSQWKKIELEDYNDEIKSFQFYYAGDVSLDKKVNSNDALKALQVSTGSGKLNACQKALADLNADGQVNAADALKILQLATGLISAV